MSKYIQILKKLSVGRLFTKIFKTSSPTQTLLSTLITIIASVSVVGLGYQLWAQISQQSDSGVDLKLLAQKNPVAPGEEVVIDVLMNPQTYKVSALDLQIEYDPDFFEASSTAVLRPGTLLPTILPNCDHPKIEDQEKCLEASSVREAEMSLAHIFLGACVVVGDQVSCDTTHDAIDQVVAKLYLKAKTTASGSSEIRFKQPAAIPLIGEGTQVAALGYDTHVGATYSSTTLVIEPTSSPIPSPSPVPCGYDFDGDKTISVVDIMQVSSRWNTTVGDTNYDPLYDFDSDGDIDIVDIQVIANKWNTTCQ